MLLCVGKIPLGKFFDNTRKQSQKMKIRLQTSTDSVQLAVMYIELSKVGFRMDADADDLTQKGLALFQSITGNVVTQISQQHVKEN